MEFIPDSLKLSGSLSVNNLDPDAGYPAGWSGGIHAQEIYTEGKIGIGSGGELKVSMSKEGNAYFAGNVGIGTMTPNTKLEVAGNLQILTGSNPIRFTNAWTAFPDAVTNQAEISNDTGAYKTLMIVGNKSAGLGRRVSVWDRLEVNGALIATGNVGIGIASPQDRLDIAGTLRILTGSNPIRFTNAWTAFPDAVTNQAEISNDTVSFKTFMIVGNKSAGLGRRVSIWDRLEVNGTLIATGNVGIGTGDPRFTLEVNGNAAKPGGGSWTNSSDIRLKKNVKPLQRTLNKLLKLRGVSYEWKKPEKHGDLIGEQMGLIAQEVEEIFPEWVDTEPDGMKNLTIRGFEALTVEAFRELEARVKALEKKLNIGE